MKMDILIYRHEKSYDNEIVNDESIVFKVWQPTFFNLIHSYYPKKYILFSLFHVFHLFSNSHFYIVEGLVSGQNACSLMIVPKFYRWLFMKDNDVQFAYVITKGVYKNRGLGSKLISFSIDFLNNKNFSGNIWYVTDSDNKPSQRLAEKFGFELKGKGSRKETLFGLLKKLDIQR
jgi:ribosomal protein S18 acetylase RimI-like enzyme